MLKFVLFILLPPDLAKGKAPVIVAMPPVPNSQHPFERRKFAYGCIDYQGPARLLTSSGKTRINKTKKPAPMKDNTLDSSSTCSTSKTLPPSPRKTRSTTNKARGSNMTKIASEPHVADHHLTEVVDDSEDDEYEPESEASPPVLKCKYTEEPQAISQKKVCIAMANTATSVASSHITNSRWIAPKNMRSVAAAKRDDGPLLAA
jgi:hypothetical protein